MLTTQPMSSALTSLAHTRLGRTSAWRRRGSTSWLEQFQSRACLTMMINFLAMQRKLLLLFLELLRQKMLFLKLLRQRMQKLHYQLLKKTKMAIRPLRTIFSLRKKIESDWMLRRPRRSIKPGWTTSRT